MQGIIDYLVRWPLRILAWCVLRLHYKIRVNNKEVLNGLSGAVIAPSHIALSDTVITQSEIWAKTRARPVAYSGQYNTYPWLMRLIRAFPLNSTVDGGGDWQLRKIRLQQEAVQAAQHSGDNILIYPAGKIKTGLIEDLGSKTAVYDMISARPETPLVLVRIRGLHGSILSKYHTGGASLPSGGHIWKQIKQNWWQFLPFVKRTVVDLDMERIDRVPADKLESVEVFNRWLEDWYNAVPDQLIPGRDGQSFKVEGFDYESRPEELDDTPIDEAVFAQVQKLLQTEFGVEASEISLDTQLEGGLGIDSFGRASIPLLLEDTFRVHISDDVELEFVRDVVIAAQGDLGEVDTDTFVVATPDEWQDEDRQAPVWIPESQSLPHAFLLTRDRVGGSAVACGGTNALGVDEIRTYREKLARSLLIADHIKRMPGDHIGLMLPATVAADVVVMACMMAGKTVVPFNWTVGASALDHSITVSGVDVILSSDMFLEKAQMSLSDEAMDKIITLEGLLAGSTGRKLGTVARLIKGRLLARLPAGMLHGLYRYSMDPDDVAVVLFTSGSESAPKGVPLTHRNVMACVKGALSAMQGKPEDVMLAFLPPFHSFGFSMEMMLCATTGLRIAFEPDPKRYRRLAMATQKWQATLVPGTPDFVAGMLDAAENPTEQFATVRAFLTGAQKAPDVLKARVAELGKDYFEGYGITETAPLVSMTRPGEVPIGVGKAIDDVKIAIVSIEPNENGWYGKMETNQEGRIFVAGPTVFAGYLSGVPDPFVDFDGVRYYNTGDLGYIDEQGNLTISGRLKRFLKVAGEMVSLPAVEDVLVSAWPSGEDGPVVAIDGVEGEEGGAAIICLYTTDTSITLEDVHTLLRREGVVGRAWPRHLRVIDEIPLLGTGKVNYRGLEPDPQTVADEDALVAAQ